MAEEDVEQDVAESSADLDVPVIDEGDGYADFHPTPTEDPEPEPTPLPEVGESATAVLRVCRNGWNTIDTRAVGGHWFSA